MANSSSSLKYYLILLSAGFLNWTNQISATGSSVDVFWNTVSESSTITMTKSNFPARSLILENVARHTVPYAVTTKDSLNHVTRDPDIRKLLERDDIVSATLHYLELTNYSLNASRGDKQRSCVRTSLDYLGYKLSPSTYSQFDRQAAIAVKMANVLTGLLWKVKNESDPLYSIYTSTSFLYSMAKVNVKSDRVLCGSGIAFQRGDNGISGGSLFYPCALRRGRHIISKNLAESYNFSYDDPTVPGTEWFWKQSVKNMSDFLSISTGTISSATASNTLSSNGETTTDEDNVSDSFDVDSEVNASMGVWSSPYLDCGGTFSWLITFSVPFFGRRNGSSMDFRGVATVSIDLQQVGVNQCAKDGSLFSDTHKCPKKSTLCVPVTAMGMGFRRGNYKCVCRPGFYFPTPKNQTTGETTFFKGAEVEAAFLRRVLEHDTTTESSTESSVSYYPDDFRCLPCRRGCDTCADDSPCRSEANLLLKSIVLGLQSFTTTLNIVLIFVIFRLRKSKAVANAMWIMLETVLIGSLLIYQTVIIRYFEPSMFSCLLEPWFRELGFAVCYGAIILKIYRILAEFQTRKAHRVCVRDKDLMKYLTAIILVVAGYMAAWTAVMTENIEDGRGIVDHGLTKEGLRYTVCKALWWDYITETGEVIFLFLGIYLTYCIRNAKRDCFHEKCALCWAVYIEFLFSMILYSIRHIVWLQMDPDYIFFMYFLRCQMTVSLNLFFIFTPKLWYHHRPPEALDGRNRNFSTTGVVETSHDHIPEAMKLHEAIVSNGELDFSDVNLADMDPEDIRCELRRVYTQLQVLRNKTMRKDNPHISKRRGGRKVTHRRFSLQPFHHKHKHNYPSIDPSEITEISKTPEESTASAEGVNPVTTGPNDISIGMAPLATEESSGTFNGSGIGGERPQTPLPSPGGVAKNHKSKICKKT